MGAGFSSLYCKIHYIEIRYIKVWVYYINVCTLKIPSFFKEISVLLGQTSHRDAGRLLNIIDEDNLNEGMLCNISF